MAPPTVLVGTDNPSPAPRPATAASGGDRPSASTPRRSPGSVLLVDAVVPPGDEPHTGTTLGLMTMAALTGGERREVGFRALFEAAGPCLSRVVPTPSVPSVVEGVSATG